MTEISYMQALEKLVDHIIQHQDAYSEVHALAINEFVQHIDLEETPAMALALAKQVYREGGNHECADCTATQA